MRKVFLLAKTLLKGGSALTTKRKSKSAWVLPVVLGISFMVFAFSIIMVTLEIYDALATAGMQHVLLNMAVGATSVVIFFFGIIYVVSTMYHADDIEMLMALPLRAWQILGAKFITLIVYEYIMEAFILLPILVGFAIKAGTGGPYVIYSVLMFAILAVIALAMAAVIVMVVMRFTGIGKNKQAFKFVGGLIAVALAVGLNILVQSGMAALDSNQIAALAAPSSAAVTIGNIFPGTGFGANALVLSNTWAGLGQFALFLLSCAAAAAVFLGVGQLAYFKGVVGVSETSAKRKAISQSDLSRQTKRAAKLAAYTRKEIRLIVRSPIAFMNCVLMNFLWPVIIIAYMFTRGGSFAQVRAVISGMDDALLIAIIVAVCAFVASTTAITSTAISREGKSLYFMKYIPMDMARQLRAKIISGLIFPAAGFILLIAAAIVLGVGVLPALVGLALGLLASAVIAVIGLLIDVARPKRDWVNEQQAIKQNLNVVLHMLCGIGVAAVVALPVILLGMPLGAAIAYIAVALAVGLVLLLRRVQTASVRRIQRMDA